LSPEISIIPKKEITLIVKHLDHLNISVRDFDETVKWYARVFGFAKVEDGVQDGVRWGVIRGGDAMLCIYEHPSRKHLARFELAGRKVHGVSHFGLRITDEKEWLAIVEREKLDILYDGVIGWPNSQSWYLKDPTGYEIEVALWTNDQIGFGTPGG